MTSWVFETFHNKKLKICTLYDLYKYHKAIVKNRIGLAAACQLGGQCTKCPHGNSRTGSSGKMTSAEGRQGREAGGGRATGPSEAPGAGTGRCTENKVQSPGCPARQGEWKPIPAGASV